MSLCGHNQGSGSDDAETCGGEKSDVVYDLGCGDGRIVIAAANIDGARGVGIDIDPRRILESKNNAKKAGVESLVRFEENDLFKAAYGQITRTL
jgi:predicted RNA methylase